MLNITAHYGAREKCISCSTLKRINRKMILYKSKLYKSKLQSCYAVVHADNGVYDPKSG